MPIYKAISYLKNSAPLSKPQALAFINSLSPKVQTQVIAAIYIGRDHLYADKWNQDIMLSTDYIDHIPQQNFAQIVHEKNSALITYLQSIERCAKNEGFDLNNL
ncbi:hypothetical protein [Shewanella algae]|uniref:hypothetical protein n=1 Tax=Shewanella algae TaxID=38313 RepID=UPI000B8AA48E|nr:hypothetical protein [Shewanella algae]OXS01214.1 hypothetical protein AMR44_08525 [Shewanella algae]